MSATPRAPYDGPAVVLVGGQEIPVHARLMVTMCTRLGEEWGGEVTPEQDVDLNWLLHANDSASVRTDRGEAAILPQPDAVIDSEHQRIPVKGSGLPPF
ncbi:DUF4873 domain-containing protein [Actinacidiphila rubida]|uniref:DUF4873 domain-containing protein n=1 Tax=Actinacidiphila rubida TaxID=310780 RepID=A0A1H8NJA2_9ACTN|nr:DUF4873 domain-containing protein [Actinacidiphila rubida]SEO29675.1 protein of unknown function [Actinacidiphila rubida]